MADIGGEEIGYGLRLLAQSAESVTAVALSELPEGRFDVVVAFRVIEDLEHPQELVVEAKRLLKEGGVLLISIADKKQTAVNDRAGIDGGGRGMYVPEFRELLERHFEHVRLYRQGAVAGGLVFPLSEELTGATVPVESIRLSSSGPHLGMESPMTRSVMAVCSDDAEAHVGEEERAYLLVDRDRRVFDESEERAEDVELMQDEIRRMQETEVQDFLKAASAQQLPFGALLRLIPQVLLYELHFRHEGSQEASQKVSNRGDVALAETRHRWQRALAEARRRRDTIIERIRGRRDVTLELTRHRRSVALAEVRHRLEMSLAEIRHRRNVALAEACRRRDTVIEATRSRRNVALELTRHQRNAALAAARHRQSVALAEIRHRRNVALEEARRRRDAVIEASRRRRDVALELTRHRRNVALAAARHRRNLVLAEIRHRRNLTLELIIHRRNIIHGNMRVIRQKSATGLAKGAFRRLSALYRRLSEDQKP